jgi:GT2 family glycosyltransferase
MELSLGILAFSVEPRFIAMTQLAIDSYRGAEEIIVVENGPYHEYSGVDTYIRFSENQFFTKAANTILKMAKHEYVAVVNNDTHLEMGDLHSLCKPDTVVSPFITTQPDLKPFMGSFFVIPKTIIEKVGYLDEQFQLYYSDTDYLTRLTNAGVKMEREDSVLVYHHIGSSTEHLNTKTELRKGLEDDKPRYYKKYGID